MLHTFTPAPTLATSDMGRATAFYEGLGFSKGDEMPDGVMFNAGDGRFLVYQSAYAGTNKATALTFEIPDDQFDAVMEHLRGKGVTFQTFEMDGAVWEGDVMVADGMRSAWFADPDGNILNVGTRG